MGRRPCQWGATEFLASFDLMQKVEYDESKYGFPWGSLMTIASRLRRTFGVRYNFHVDKATKRKYITRYL